MFLSAFTEGRRNSCSGGMEFHAAFEALHSYTPYLGREHIGYSGSFQVLSRI